MYCVALCGQLGPVFLLQSGERLHSLSSPAACLIQDHGSVVSQNDVLNSVVNIVLVQVVVLQASCLLNRYAL